MQSQKNNTSDREISISRELNAPIELVWEVWTHPDHIKNWWGPNGFSNTISIMDVQPEGKWNLVMHGPDGTDYINESIFKEIIPLKRIVYEHISYPKILATIQFESRGKKTFIHWNMLFESREIMIDVIKKHNAQEGLKQNLEKLESYLSVGYAIKKQLKTNNTARVCTYLNFPGNTETAFNFYKSVFKTDFGGKGLQRFGDFPAQEGMPPLSEADKKLIIHAELTILGGHVLMATDAPESFGMKVIQGNNMHINLEPDSREETRRLFDALSAGGNINMPLQDMFWGAYYGSLTDKYGINWMLNFVQV